MVRLAKEQKRERQRDRYGIVVTQGDRRPAVARLLVEGEAFRGHRVARPARHEVDTSALQVKRVGLDHHPVGAVDHSDLAHVGMDDADGLGCERGLGGPTRDGLTMQELLGQDAPAVGAATKRIFVFARRRG